MTTVPHHAQKSNYTIYALVDPRDYSTRYVGISSNVYRRFIQHIQCKGNNTEKNAWICELQELNLMAIMQMLGTADTYEDAMQFEGQWIRDYCSSGASLFNKDRVPRPNRNVFASDGNGRKSKYDQVRDIILTRYSTGTWPVSLSDDMKRWYEFYYFTKPNKKKDGNKYERHVKSYARGRMWIEASMTQEANREQFI